MSLSHSELNTPSELASRGSDEERAELVLSAAQSQFQAVFESLDDGVMIFDMEGTLLRANAAVGTIVGLLASNSLPADVEQSFALYEMSTLQGAIISKHERPIARLIRGEILRDFEACLRRRDAVSRRIIAYSGTTVRDALGKTLVYVTLKDITARKEAEASLLLSEQRLQYAQRVAKLGSWDLDVDTDTLYGSEQLFEIFGVDRVRRGERLGAFTARIHPADRATFDVALAKVIADQAPLDVELRLVFPDGTLKWAHAKGEFSRGGTGGPALVSGTVVDITARRRATEALLTMNTSLEQRVRDRTQELALAKSRAESADRLKSAFLATMSHELRTPLNSILGFTSILLRGMAGPLTSEQSKQLGMVHGSGLHLLALINDVLDISKIEAGQLEIFMAPFDVRTSVEKLIRTIAPMAEKKSLLVRVRAPPEWQILVSDQRRVEQVLLNLLNNAIKFTERGTIELSVDFLDDDSPPAGGVATPCVRFCVTDTGAGIADSNIEMLFAPFQQLETGRTRQHEGTGLGLAICRRLAGLLGGRVTAQSRLGVGSVFLFTIPQCQAP